MLFISSFRPNHRTKFYSKCTTCCQQEQPCHTRAGILTKLSRFFSKMTAVFSWHWWLQIPKRTLWRHYDNPGQKCNWIRGSAFKCCKNWFAQCLSGSIVSITTYGKQEQVSQSNDCCVHVLSLTAASKSVVKLVGWCMNTQVVNTGWRLGWWLVWAGSNYVVQVHSGI